MKNNHIANDNMKRSGKIGYFIILSFIIGPPILFTVIAVYAAQNADVTLNSSEAEGVWAVIMGISGYGDPHKSLHGGPINSAKLINSTLVDTFGWPISHINLLLDEENRVDDDVTEIEIKDAVDRLSWLETKNDTVLFYFAGHGGKSESGEPECIVPNRAGGIDQWISEYELADMLSRLESDRVIIILDACHSGGFAWDGLNPGVLAKDGRIVLTACKEDEYSYALLLQSETKEYGRFTWYLAEGLKSRKTVESAFRYAQEKTTQTDQLGRPQHPQMYDGINPKMLDLDMISIVLGIITLAGASALAVVFIRRRRQLAVSQPQILPSAYLCPVCNTNLTWTPLNRQLYCPNCKRRFN